jgi:tight adherence protein C
MELLVAIGVFGLVGGFFYLVLAPKTASDDETIQKRLQAISAGPARTSRVRLLGENAEQTFWEQITRFFLGERELPAIYSGFRPLLHQAGYAGERAVRIFWGIRIFLTGALGAGAMLVSTVSGASFPKMILGVAFAAAAGYLLPFLYVRRRAKYRVLELQETLPDTLDLLVVCVEAGLGIDAALVRVANEQVEQGLIIGEELQLTTQEIQAGIGRREALGRLGDRSGLDDLQSLVTFLIQTEELGGSIARSLRVFATTMRQKRSQRAEELARKAVIKLILPLAFCILPALFLVIFAPAVLNIFKLFASAPGQ